jgi:hypothetical protein
MASPKKPRPPIDEIAESLGKTGKQLRAEMQAHVKLATLDLLVQALREPEMLSEDAFEAPNA